MIPELNGGGLYETPKFGSTQKGHIAGELLAPRLPLSGRLICTKHSVQIGLRQQRE